MAIVDEIQRSIFLSNNNIDSFVKEATVIGCVGLDTEFERVHSYFPRLSIAQFSLGGKATYIYDFLDKSVDPAPLMAMLQDNTVIKILHSARQDVEAISYALGVVMNPVVDTQVMAEELSFGKQVSYAHLVKKFFGIMVEKELTRSNWMHRPLGDEELLYASIDSYYLIDLYGQMRIIMSDNQFSNMRGKVDRMVASAVHRKSPRDCWHGFRRFLISTGYDFSGGESVIRGLFLFREYLARRRNVLPGMIIDDAKMTLISTLPNPTVRTISDILHLPPYVTPEGIVSLILKLRSKNDKSDPLDQGVAS